MEMYKDVPEQFHNQFMETIAMLEQQKENQGIRKFRAKRVLPLVAVLVLAISTLTVSAACVFIWHQAAKEKLGVTEELAESMTNEGIAKQESASALEGNVSINMLQSVMADKYCYILLSVDVPEEIVVDEDTLFREIRVEADVEFDGCVINQVPESINGTNSLWEIQLLTLETENYGGVEATIILNDLIQTEKTEVTETLVEGEWRLSFTLPLEVGLLVSHDESVLQIGHHEVSVNRMEISPFEIRIYGEKEELQHAIQYQNQKVSGIEYRDGTYVEEGANIDVTKGHTDERTGEYYVGVDLTTAIDIEKYSGIVLEPITFGGQVADLPVGEVVDNVSMEELSPAEVMDDVGMEELSPVEAADNVSMEEVSPVGVVDDVSMEELSPAEVADSVRMGELSPDEAAEMTVLYERFGHKLLYNGDFIFLWDELCQMGKEIVNLKELGYDKEHGKIVQASEIEQRESHGDRIEVGPGGKTITIWAGEETYFYEVRY